MNESLRCQEVSLLLSALHGELRRSDEADFLHRVHCVHLVDLGYSCTQVADWFGRNPRTIERWIRDFRNDGLDGLRNDKKPGRTPRLDWNRLELLSRDLARSPAEFGLGKTEWDGAILSDHIHNTHGIRLSVRQCQRLMRQIGCPDHRKQAPSLSPEQALAEEFLRIVPIARNSGTIKVSQNQKPAHSGKTGRNDSGFAMA